MMMMMTTMTKNKMKARSKNVLTRKRLTSDRARKTTKNG